MNRISAYFRRMNKIFDRYACIPKQGRAMFYWNCTLGRALRHMSIDDYCYYYSRLGRPDCWKRALNRDKAWHMWKLNTQDAVNRLMDKAGCLERYAKYVHRAWMEPAKKNEAEFIAFARQHGSYIVKPRASGRGEGVYISRYISDDICKNEYRVLCEEDAIVEEIIRQHDALNALYPDSVNTIRVASVLTDDGVILLNSCMRIGNGGVIDNFCQGGMTAQIDFETGRIETPAVDKEHNVYEKHPITGTPFVGYQLPHWDLLKQTLKEMALVDPDAVFVGWDMAITPEGVDMVECNNHQGFGWQYALGTDWTQAYKAANKEAWKYFRRREKERKAK